MNWRLESIRQSSGCLVVDGLLIVPGRSLLPVSHFTLGYRHLETHSGSLKLRTFIFGVILAFAFRTEARRSPLARPLAEIHPS